MKRSHVILLILAILAAAPGAAFSQYIDFPEYLEINTMGGGARAAGMGGAFLGLSEGEMAYSWNPAGMIFAEKRSIGLEFISVNDKFTRIHEWFFDPSSEVVSSQMVEAKREHTNLNFSGFNVPFAFMERDWAFGGGFRNVYDMKLEYETAGIQGSKDIYTASAGVDAISVSLAGKVNENISIGVTGNNYIRSSESNIYTGNGFVYQAQPSSPADSVDLRENSIDHYSGFNFDIGVMGKYNMFKGGVIFHTPYNLKQKTKFTRYAMIPPTPIGAIDRVTYTTSIPFGYSIGISAAPIEKLIVAVDFDSRAMSGADININFESSYIFDRTYDPKWEDINQFRLGAEYSLKTEFATIPVRVGFRNNPGLTKPLSSRVYSETDSVYTLSYGNQTNTNILTLGTGLHFEKAWIDMAYQFGSSSYTVSSSRSGSTIEAEQKYDYSKLLLSAGMNF